MWSREKKEEAFKQKTPVMHGEILAAQLDE